jgi:hypothetical protein
VFCWVGVRFGVGVCGFWLVPDLLAFHLFHPIANSMLFNVAVWTMGGSGSGGRHQMTWHSGSLTLGSGGDSDDVVVGFGGAVVAWRLWMVVT